MEGPETETQESGVSIPTFTLYRHSPINASLLDSEFGEPIEANATGPILTDWSRGYLVRPARGVRRHSQGRRPQPLKERQRV